MSGTCLSSNQFIPFLRKIAVLFALSFSFPIFADELVLPLKGEDVQVNYWPVEKNSRGAIIWVRAEPSMLPDAIAEALSKKGWGIILIESKHAAELKRLIPAAIRSFRKLHYQRIILLHQGDRLQQTLDYFKKRQTKRVDGFIFLSAYESKKTLNLQAVSSPVMDICGQFDYQYVLSDFQKRKEQGVFINYRSIQVPGADNSYEYQLKMLTSYLDGWMQNIPPVQPSWLPFQLSEFPLFLYQKQTACALKTEFPSIN